MAMEMLEAQQRRKILWLVLHTLLGPPSSHGQADGSAREAIHGRKMDGKREASQERSLFNLKRFENEA